MRLGGKRIIMKIDQAIKHVGTAKRGTARRAAWPADRASVRRATPSEQHGRHAYVQDDEEGEPKAFEATPEDMKADDWLTGTADKPFPAPSMPAAPPSSAKARK